MASHPPYSTTSTLTRALAILDAFTLAHPVLTIADVTERFAYTRSTAYRYLRELAGAGLVTQAAPGVYSLGPRIIELERLLALTDPLYRTGMEILARERCENSALLLHNLYEDQVLCIFKAGPDTLVCGGRRITIRRARGLPFPLFQGAASLALLPWLSSHRIRETYLRHAAAIARAGLGTQWDEFRRSMAAIRRAGYATSHGTITPRVSGVAVPILAPGGKRVLGSLARALPSKDLAGQGEVAHVGALQALGERIAERCVRASRRRSRTSGPSVARVRHELADESAKSRTMDEILRTSR